MSTGGRQLSFDFEDLEDDEDDEVTLKKPTTTTPAPSRPVASQFGRFTTPIRSGPRTPSFAGNAALFRTPVSSSGAPTASTPNISNTLRLFDLSFGTPAPDQRRMDATGGLNSSINTTAAPPAASVSSSLESQERYEELLFAEKLQSASNNWKLIKSFEQICNDRCQQIRSQYPAIRKGEPIYTQEIKAFEEYRLLRDERNTWHLVHDLFKKRLTKNDVMVTSSAGEGPIRPLLTHRDIWNRLCNTDPTFRETLIVVEWLEKIAGEELHYAEEPFRFAAKTKDAIEHPVREEEGEEEREQGEEVQAANTKKKPAGKAAAQQQLATLVSELDPDAAIRQGKKWHEDDESADQRTLRDLWSLVRAGKLQEACRLCTKTLQYFRAASLAGAVLFRDPNLEEKENSAKSTNSNTRENISTAIGGEIGAVVPQEGNVNRTIWKFSCMELSNEKAVSVLERSLYAILCGNLEAALPACANWDDCVWAHFRCVLEAAYERELCKFDFSALGADDGVSIRDRTNWWRTGIRTPDDIFAALRLSPDLVVRKGAFEPYHQVQALLICGRIAELVSLLAEWVSVKYSGQWVQPQNDPRPACPPQVMRCAAHLVLLFADLSPAEWGFKEGCAAPPAYVTACHKILSAYVRHLIDTEQNDAVAFYTSKLPRDDQIALYGSLLRNVRDRAERERMLALANREGLDSFATLKHLVSSITAVTNDVTSDEVTAEDAEKIDAIDWLGFDPSPNHRLELLKHASALARNFILSRKFEAAERVLEKAPADTVSVLMRHWRSLSSLPESDTRVLKEFVDLRDLLVTLRKYQRWFQHHLAKPKSPPLPTTNSIPEQIAYENAKKIFDSETRKWQDLEKQYSDAAIEAVHRVLLAGGVMQLTDTGIVGGHWLNCQDSDAERNRQLEMLRRQAIPQLVFNLNHIFIETDRLAESLQLADLLADEHRKLYAVFSAEEMKKFLKLMRDSALLSLSRNGQPLPY